MKMKISQLRLLLLLIGALSFAPRANAFYNSTTGRWLSRDPLGETSIDSMIVNSTGVKKNQLRSKPAHRIEINPSYIFAGDDSLNRVDHLGLKVISSSCTDEQKDQIQQAVDTMCAKALSRKTGCCDFIPPAKDHLTKICKPDFLIVITCLPSQNDDKCAGGNCAGVGKKDDFEESGVIYLCPSFWGKSPCTTTRECIVLHELLHGAGLKGDPNTSIQEVEKCVGCKESYKDTPK